jgi:hypothetical protein
LRWIHVDADDDLSLFPDELARAFDQTQMTFVQITHRRHKTDLDFPHFQIPRQSLHGRD